MNITNVTVTKVAEESTENADYQLEYSIVNDALTRVHASTPPSARRIRMARGTLRR